MDDELPPERDEEFGWDLIVGHDRPAKALRRACLAGRPHPAYLLLGPDGVGKRLLARTIGATLICEAEDERLRPCGACGACSKVAAHTHIDLWPVLPSGKSKTITVDQVAEIQRKLTFRRLEGRHRVVLVLGAGTMNETAQNKLLKTLEEPPEGTVILLTASHAGLLLQTVRSRCQKILLGPVGLPRLEEWLVRRGASSEAARAAAAGSSGLPGRALALLDPEQAETHHGRIAAVAQALGGDEEAGRTLRGGLDRDREGAREVVETMQELARDAMVAALGADVAPIHPGAQVSLEGQQAPREAAELISELEDARDRLSRNVHPGGVLEDALRRARRLR